MQVLSIKAEQHIDQGKARLDQELKGLAHAGIFVRTSEFTRANLAFLRCAGEQARPEELPRALELFRRLVAESLTHVITQDWRKAHVRRLVRESYNRFGQDELEAVCAAVVRSITDAEGTASHADPRLRILSRLLEFLERHDEVVLEGCVSFRLRD